MSLFGTDGVRGKVNGVVTPELALSIGAAAGKYFYERGAREAIIGRDTRRSGSMLGAALAAGITSSGIDVHVMAVVPTPCVSFAVRSGEYGFAAVISASHNPACDNGIKLLGADGAKLPINVESEIEAMMKSERVGSSPQVGVIESNRIAIEEYVQWLRSHLISDLSGWRIAMDCSNGAAYELAPKLFTAAGAEVITTATTPDGDNINEDCGATNPHTIQKLTATSRSRVGICFDGDADRCVFSDSDGNLVNGDRFMGIWALNEKRLNRLRKPIVVGTEMSNMGFEIALSARGLQLERTDVGDRNVADRLKEIDGQIGGEQSGHIIFRDLAPTGDGLLTAVQMMNVMVESGQELGSLEPVFENWPQLMINIQVGDKSGVKKPVVGDAIARVREELGSAGRVVVRASGTQPMVRVMVEAKDEKLRDEKAEELAKLILNELGGEICGSVDLTNALGD